MNDAIEQIWENLRALPKEDQLDFYVTLFGSLEVRNPKLLIENARTHIFLKEKLMKGVDISL